MKDYFEDVVNWIDEDRSELEKQAKGKPETAPLFEELSEELLFDNNSAMMVDYLMEFKKNKSFNEFVSKILADPKKDLKKEIQGPRGEIILYWHKGKFSADFGNFDKEGRPLALSQTERIHDYIKSQIK